MLGRNSVDKEMWMCQNLEDIGNKESILAYGSYTVRKGPTFGEPLRYHTHGDDKQKSHSYAET